MSKGLNSTEKENSQFRNDLCALKAHSPTNPCLELLDAGAGWRHAETHS